MIKVVLHLLLFNLTFCSLFKNDAKPRKLQLPDSIDTNYFVGQLQNTHSLMNDIKNQDRRQNFIRNVADQFSGLSARLDSFRSELFKKVNLLHMSLERPKIPMSSPGPMKISALVDPLVSSNKFSKAISSEFTPRIPNHFLEANNLTNPFKTNIGQMDQGNNNKTLKTLD